MEKKKLLDSMRVIFPEGIDFKSVLAEKVLKELHNGEIEIITNVLRQILGRTPEEKDFADITRIYNYPGPPEIIL
jgi:hypothetical protein